MEHMLVLTGVAGVVTGLNRNLLRATTVAEHGASHEPDAREEKELTEFCRVMTLLGLACLVYGFGDTWRGL